MLYPAMFSSPTEWMFILVLVVLLFGGKKIPELFRGVGRGVGELQKGLEEGKRSLMDTVNEEKKPEEPKPEEKKQAEGTTPR